MVVFLSEFTIIGAIMGDDFKLCMMKMQFVLFKQRCAEALKGEAMLSASMSLEGKTKMVDKVRSVNVLFLSRTGPRGCH